MIILGLILLVAGLIVLVVVNREAGLICALVGAILLIAGALIDAGGDLRLE